MKKEKITKKDLLKRYLIEYRFMQNEYFCKEIKVKQPTLKSWLKSGKNGRTMPDSEVERLYPVIKKIVKILKKV